MICKQCNQEYEAQRSTSKYCSAKCRKLAFQKVSVPSTGQNAKDSISVADRRGKQITKFEHLPADVQRTINRLSDSPQEHNRRTAIAIDYQHQFPHRYHNTGVALSEHRYNDKVYAGVASIFNEGKEPRFKLGT
mgnify:CR=1 FL=1